MPRLSLCFIVACCSTFPGHVASAVAESSAASMPRERAEATFKDPRVVAFLKSVTDGFKVSCKSPDLANTKAKVSVPNMPKDAPPEASGYASTWYEVAIECSGGVTVTTMAEFTPLTGDKPLDLVLSLSQILKNPGE